MANDKVVRLTVDVQAKTDGIISGTKQIQDSLNKLKMPDKLRNSFNDAISDLLDRIDKVKDLTAGNQFKLVDSKKVQSELNAIEKDFNKIVRSAQTDIKGISLKNSIKGFDKIDKAISNYNKGLEQGKLKIVEQEKEAKKLKDILDEAKIRSKNIKDEKRSAEGSNRASIEVAKSIFNQAKRDNSELEAQVKKKRTEYLDSGHSTAKAEAYLKNSKLYKEYLQSAQAVEEADKRLKQTQADLDKTTENYGKQLEESEKIVTKAKQDYDSLEDSIKNLKEEFNNLSVQEFEKLKTVLQDLFGKGEIEFDPSSIQSFEELQEKLALISQTDLYKIEDILKDIGIAAEDTKEKTNGLNNEIDTTTDKQKELNSQLENMKSKIAYFFGMENAVNLFKRGLQAAYDTVKDLDAVMTETAVVTDFSIGDMWSQLPEYTKRANELGVTIHDTYEAATIFYQQGLSTNEVMQLSNQTLKMARIAGLDAAEATDRMTNALRGFNMELNETNATRVSDVYSKLAAITAADVDEISTAMTKVASLANNANMEFETTAAFLSQIIETTRESAETAGTALKTVVARFSEVKELYSEGDLIGTDTEGEEINVNKVSEALKTAGINLNEYFTGMKGLDEIFLELASKWNTLDQVQQRYIATTAAGSRQQSRFIAMMQDYGRTTELVSAANNAAGASQQQYEKTLDSLQSKLNKLQNAWNEFVMSIADNSLIKGAVDLLTGLIDAINKLTSVLPGPLNGIAKIGVAFGALKGGKALLNGILPTLSTNLKDAGGKGAIGYISAFKNTLAERAKIGDITDSLKNKLSTFGKDFLTTIQNPIGYDTEIKKAEEELEKLQKQQAELLPCYPIDPLAMSDCMALNEQIDKTQTKLDALNKVKEDGLTKQFQTAATACGTLGAACLGLSKIFDAMGLDSVSDGFSTMGTVLISIAAFLPILGTIFKGTGKTIQIAGFTAEVGWLWLLAISAGIAIIAGTIAALASAIEDDTEKYKRLTEEAEKTAEAASNVATAYDNLKDSLEDLGNQETELEKLTKGTTEWYEAVAKVNQSVLELTKSYPELAKYVESTNGVLSLNEEGIQQTLQNYNDQIFEAQSAAAYAKLEVIQQEKKINNASVNKLYEDVAKGKVTAQSFNVDSETFGQFMAIAKSQNAEQTAYYNQLVSSLFLELEDTIPEDLTDIYKGILDPDKINSIIEENASEVKIDNAYKEFFKRMYGSDIEVTSTGAIKQNGEEILKKDSARKQYVAGNLKTYGIDIAKQDLKKIENSTKDNEKLRKAIFDFYKNGQESMSKANADAIRDMDLTEIQSVLGQELASKFRAVAENVSTSYQDNIGKYLNSTNNDSIQQQINLLLDSNTTLSLSSIESYLDNLLSIYGKYGEDSATAFAIGLSGALKDLTDEQQEAIMRLAENYDFTNYEDIQVFGEALKNLGYDIPEDAIEGLTKEFTNLAGITRKIDLSSLNEAFSDLLKLSKDLQDRDDSEGITQEEYDQIIASLPDMADSFVFDGENYLYSDGTMSTLASAIVENTAALREDTARQLEQDIAIGEEIDAILENKKLNSMYGKVDTETLKTGIVDDMGSIREFMDAVFGNRYSGLDDAKLRAIYQEQFQAYTNLNQNQIDYKDYNDKYAASNAFQQLKNTTAATQNDSSISNLSGQALEDYNDLLDTTIKNIDVTTEELDSLTKGFEEQNIETEDAVRLAKELAIKNDVLEGKIDNLRKTIGDELDALNDTTKTAQDLGQSYQNIAKSATALFGVDVSAEFVANNIQAFKDLEAGVPEAYQNICNELNRQTISSWTDILGNTETGAQSIQNIINALDGLEFDVYGMADLTPMINAMIAAGMTADQVTEKLNGITGLSLNWNPGMASELIGAMQYLSHPINLTTASPGDIQAYNKALQTLATAKNLGMLTVSKNTVDFNSTGGGGYSPSSSGGGGSDNKPEYWENPYDELYNLNEKINESIRTRAELERTYQKLLAKTTSSTKEVHKAYLAQITALEQEAELQRELEKGRLRQLNNIGNLLYIDDEGNRSTYASLGVMKYASYDQATGLIQIDWSGLDALSKDSNQTEFANAVESYISKLEELVQNYEDVRDSVWDIEDKIEDLNNEVRQNYLTFEERVLDAIVDERQKQIDAYQKLSDAINDSTSRVLTKMQEQIGDERQARENEKTAQEIADKEARLSYLRRDTSNANMLEEMQLQEELDDMRQSYTDSLVDQAIEEMQKEADKAQEQRERQIELLQAQLEFDQENGLLWDQVYSYLNPGSENNLKTLLQSTDGFIGMSYFARDNWIQEFTNQFLSAMEGYSAWKVTDAQEKGNTITARGTDGSTANIKYDQASGQWTDSEGNIYKGVSYDRETKTYTFGSIQKAKKVEPQSSNTVTSNTTSTVSPFSRIEEAYNYINGGAWGNEPKRTQNGLAYGYTNKEIALAQELINLTYPPSLGGAGYSWEDAKRLIGYKTGGIANFTGPAWLDGTKSKPELVLNARDTENFIQLKDILSGLLKGNTNTFATSGGEFNFDIDINADISDDYDVEQLADKVKGIIYDEAMYKNVNTINRLR